MACLWGRVADRARELFFIVHSFRSFRSLSFPAMATRECFVDVRDHRVIGFDMDHTLVRYKLTAIRKVKLHRFFLAGLVKMLHAKSRGVHLITYSLLRNILVATSGITDVCFIVTDSQY